MPRPALRAIECPLALHEQLEHARQELGRDADAVVPHRNLEVGARVAHGDDDLAMVVRELHGVLQHVRHGLHEPRAVTADVERRRVALDT